MREAVDGAIKARLLEKTVDSGPWPCAFCGARQVKLQVPARDVALPPEPPPPLPPKPGFKVAQAELRPHQIQDLAEIIGELVNAAVGYELVFRLRVELGGAAALPDEVVQKINELLGNIAVDLKLE